VWMRLFGGGEAAVRGLSVLFGIAAIAALWGAARRQLGPAYGWLAAALLAVSPLHVYFSREARNYALASLLAVPVFFALLAAQEDERQGRPSAHAWRRY